MSPKIYKSPYPLPSIPTHISLSQYIFSSSKPSPSIPDSKIIIEDNWSGKALTYEKLREDVAAHAWKWRAWIEDGGLELGDGDIVGVCGCSSVDYVTAVHSVVWAGGTVALFSAQNTVSDFKHVFSIMKPRFMLVDPGVVERVLEALGDSRTVIMILGEEEGEKYPSFRRYPRHFQTKSKLELQNLPLGKHSREITACILFSSGTSGLPKAVQISHFALISGLAGMRASDPEFYNAEERSVSFAPLCHLYGFGAIIVPPCLGSYTMLMRSFSLPSFLKLSDETKATTLKIVPTIANIMAKKGVLDGFDLRSVKFILCGGARLDEGVVRVLQERLGGAPITQAYGMTEGGISRLRGCEAGKVGSVGRLFPGVEARVVDDNMNDVQPGKGGELLVKGPSVFSGYLNNPVATKEAFHEGWLKTGDIIRIDNEGFLYIFDRKKEIIKYNGFQVSPTELEALLSTHPFVSEAAVTAKWNSELGTEIPIAYIVLSAPVKITEREKGRQSVCEEVREWFDGRVAGYKKLRGGVEVIEAVPRTAIGKVMRWKLPARVEMMDKRTMAKGRL